MDFPSRAARLDYLLGQSIEGGGGVLPTVMRVSPEDGATVDVPTGTPSTAVMIEGSASIENLTFNLPDSVGSIVRMYFAIDVENISFNGDDVWNPPVTALTGDSYMLQCIAVDEWVRMSA